MFMRINGEELAIRLFELEAIPSIFLYMYVRLIVVGTPVHTCVYIHTCTCTPVQVYMYSTVL